MKFKKVVVDNNMAKKSSELKKLISTVMKSRKVGVKRKPVKSGKRKSVKSKKTRKTVRKTVRKTKKNTNWVRL